MASRSEELTLLARCAEVAVAPDASPTADQREANVFRVAGMILKPTHAEAARRLLLSSSRYFELHPDDRLEAAQIVQRGWITSLPRLHDMLAFEIQHRSSHEEPSDPPH